MKNILPFPTKRDYLSEASDWLIKVDRGLAAEEKQQLGRFLQHPQARQEFEELALLWDKLDTLSQLADILPAPEGVRSKRKIWGLPKSLAASVLFALLVPLLWFSVEQMHTPSNMAQSSGESQWFETVKGEQKQVVLGDGSLVQLNTASQLSVVYSKQSRELTLLQGEAHFAVEHDPARPFSVIAGNSLFQAVGTAFSVQLNHKQTELIVTEGKVSVTEREKIVKNKPIPLIVSNVLIEAGTIVEFTQKQEVTVKTSAAKISEKLSWRKGSIVIDDKRLDQAIEEISRYTPTKFEFLDDKTRAVKVSGRFKSGDVEALLNSLKDNFNIHHQKMEKNKVLLSVRTQ